MKPVAPLLCGLPTIAVADLKNLLLKSYSALSHQTDTLFPDPPQQVAMHLKRFVHLELLRQRRSFNGL
jgi:hypothetical protein